MVCIQFKRVDAMRHEATGDFARTCVCILLVFAEAINAKMRIRVVPKVLSPCWSDSMIASDGSVFLDIA